MYSESLSISKIGSASTQRFASHQSCHNRPPESSIDIPESVTVHHHRQIRFSIGGNRPHNPPKSPIKSRIYLNPLSKSSMANRWVGANWTDDTPFLAKVIQLNLLARSSALHTRGWLLRGRGTIFLFVRYTRTTVCSRGWIVVGL